MNLSSLTSNSTSTPNSNHCSTPNSITNGSTPNMNLNSNNSNNLNLNEQLLIRSNIQNMNSSANNNLNSLSNLNNNLNGVPNQSQLNGLSLNQFSNSVYNNTFNSQVPTSLADTYTLSSMGNFSNPMSSCHSLQQQSQNTYSFMASNGPRVYEPLSLAPPTGYLNNPSHHAAATHHAAAAAAAAAAAQRSSCQLGGYGSGSISPTQSQQTNMQSSTNGESRFHKHLSIPFHL